MENTGASVTLPAQKNFVPKFKLPAVEDYKSDPGPGFWAAFPVNRCRTGSPLISAIALMSLSLAVGLRDADRLNLVLDDLKKGADIGCFGDPRGPTHSKNAASCWEFADRITDAIAGWVDKRFVAGPFTAEEVPTDAKVNGIMCRPKPNGTVRVILNLSAPAGMSVNDGINSNDFPTSMSSTSKWVECLNMAGRGALMTKIDWSDAYKHLHVRPEDLHLQWFSWLGKYFVELCLVFGTASSPGIYDRAAKLVLDLVIRLSRFPANLVCQYLDDVCAVAPAGSTSLDVFRQTYQSVAKQLGVRLAPEDDPEKAFAPRTDGTVLGVRYDTVNWTWQIPSDKLLRLIAQIDLALTADVLQQQEIWSLVGRIIHYCPLIPTGRFNINHLVRVNSFSRMKRVWVPLDTACRRQLHFWRVILLATNGSVSIPLPSSSCPAWSREFFTDAAGGSGQTVGLGCGGVSLDWWFFVPWGRKINCGVRWMGRKLSQKMSALELVGPLICVSGSPDLVRSIPICIYVDNIGSVQIWQKGYSNSCGLCTSLVSAIGAVAAALGSHVTIKKVARCSSTGAILADALSKAAFDKFRDVSAAASWPVSLEPSWVPPSLLAWIANPSDSYDLGERIILDIRQRTPVLGYSC